MTVSLGMTKRALVVTLGLVGSLAMAQAPHIRVGMSVLVATGTEHEPYLAIDPDNPKHMVAATMVGSTVDGTFEERRQYEPCAAFASFDGGATWTRHEFATTGCGDPWVEITPEGQVVVTMIGGHAAIPEQGNLGLLVFRSADGGRTWAARP